MNVLRKCRQNSMASVMAVVMTMPITSPLVQTRRELVAIPARRSFRMNKVSAYTYRQGSLTVAPFKIERINLRNSKG